MNKKQVFATLFSSNNRIGWIVSWISISLILIQQQLNRTPTAPIAQQAEAPSNQSTGMVTPVDQAAPSDPDNG